MTAEAAVFPPQQRYFTSSFALLDPAEIGPVGCRDMAERSVVNMAAEDDEDAEDEDGADDEK